MYLVDLLSLRGNGRCDCANFRCHRAPLLAECKKPSAKTRCKHIRLVRWKLIRILKDNGNPSNLDEVIKYALKKYGDGETF